MGYRTTSRRSISAVDCPPDIAAPADLNSDEPSALASPLQLNGRDSFGLLPASSSTNPYEKEILTMRHLFRLILAAALLSTVGVTPSVADTIGFDSASRCVDITTVAGPADLVNHMILELGLCPTSPLQDTSMQDTGSLTATLGPGPLDTTVGEPLALSGPTLGADNQTLFLPLEGVSLPSLSNPSGGEPNAAQLDLVTPAVDITAVPEPGSLLLLGS